MTDVREGTGISNPHAVNSMARLTTGVSTGKVHGLSGLEPALGGTRLALRAMSIAAGFVTDLLVAAGIATQRVPAQRRGTALFDGRHDLELTEAQVAGLLGAPRGAMGAEDVGDLQGRAPHGGATASSASPTG